MRQEFSRCQPYPYRLRTALFAGLYAITILSGQKNRSLKLKLIVGWETLAINMRKPAKWEWLIERLACRFNVLI